MQSTCPPNDPPCRDEMTNTSRTRLGYEDHSRCKVLASRVLQGNQCLNSHDVISISQAGPAPPRKIFELNMRISHSHCMQLAGRVLQKLIACLYSYDVICIFQATVSTHEFGAAGHAAAPPLSRVGRLVPAAFGVVVGCRRAHARLRAGLREAAPLLRSLLRLRHLALLLLGLPVLLL
jgi:hypothetical protein